MGRSCRRRRRCRGEGSPAAQKGHPLHGGRCGGEGRPLRGRAGLGRGGWPGGVRGWRRGGSRGQTEPGGCGLGVRRGARKGLWRRAAAGGQRADFLQGRERRRDRPARGLWRGRRRLPCLCEASRPRIRVLGSSCACTGRTGRRGRLSGGARLGDAACGDLGPVLSGCTAPPEPAFAPRGLVLVRVRVAEPGRWTRGPRAARRPRRPLTLRLRAAGRRRGPGRWRWPWRRRPATLSLLSHRPFWGLQGRTGRPSLPGRAERSGRAVRAADGVSRGARGAPRVRAGLGAPGGAAGAPARAAVRAQGVRASPQRPRPGLERREDPVSQQGPKGGRPGVRAPPGGLQAPGTRRVCPARPPLRAPPERPQHRFLCAGVRGLLGGRGPSGADRARGPGLGGRDPHGDRAPPRPRVPEGPDAAPEVAVPPVRRQRPHDGVAGPLQGEAPPGLVDAARGVPAGRPPGGPVPRRGVGAVDALHLLGGVRARPGRGRRRGPRPAQVAAHAERRGGRATGRVSVPEVGVGVRRVPPTVRTLARGKGEALGALARPQARRPEGREEGTPGRAPRRGRCGPSAPRLERPESRGRGIGVCGYRPGGRADDPRGGSHLPLSRRPHLLAASDQPPPGPVRRLPAAESESRSPSRRRGEGRRGWRGTQRPEGSGRSASLRRSLLSP